MSIRTKIVEILDNYNEVVDYIELANRVYKIIDRTCIVDYSLIQDESGDIKYKVVTEGDGNLKEKK